MLSLCIIVVYVCYPCSLRTLLSVFRLLNVLCALIDHCALCSSFSAFTVLFAQCCLCLLFSFLAHCDKETHPLMSEQEEMLSVSFALICSHVAGLVSTVGSVATCGLLGGGDKRLG